MRYLVYFDGTPENNFKSFYRKVDMYGYINYLDYSDAYFVSFCNLYFVEKLGFDTSTFYTLSNNSKQIFEAAPKCNFNKYLDYISYIESTDLSIYYERFLKFNNFLPNKNIFIVCFSKKEFDFLKTVSESICIKFTASLSDDENDFDFISLRGSDDLFNNFIKNNYIEL